MLQPLDSARNKKITQMLDFIAKNCYYWNTSVRIIVVTFGQKASCPHSNPGSMDVSLLLNGVVIASSSDSIRQTPLQTLGVPWLAVLTP